MAKRDCWIVAGSQGTGKSTLLRDKPANFRLTKLKTLFPAYHPTHLHTLPGCPCLIHWSIHFVDILPQLFEEARLWWPRVVKTYLLVAPVAVLKVRIAERQRKRKNNRHKVLPAEQLLSLYTTWIALCRDRRIPVECLDSSDRRYVRFKPTEAAIRGVLLRV